MKSDSCLVVNPKSSKLTFGESLLLEGDSKKAAESERIKGRYSVRNFRYAQFSELLFSH